MPKQLNIDINQLVSDYEAGVNIHTLCQKYNCKHPTIYKKLKGRTKIRNRSEARRTIPINENYFNEVDTKNKAYILGFICADGSLSKNKYNIEIGLNIKDQYILNFIQKEIFLDGQNHIKLKEYRKNFNNKGEKIYYSCKITVNSIALCDKLISYGITPKKSLTLTWPAIISALDEGLQRAFILGYFDGDGCITYSQPEGTTKQFSCKILGTNEFCDVLIEKIKLYSGATVSKFKRGNNTYEIQIGGNRNAEKFLNWLYLDAQFYMKRKYNKYIELIQEINYIDSKGLQRNYKYLEKKYKI